MSQQAEQANKKLVARLLWIIGGMFLFAFALIPIYDVFCDVTGINGKTKGQALYEKVKVDPERLITLEFIADVDRGMPWEFRPMQKSVKVHPGELSEISYYAKNYSNRQVVGQSVPSIAPGEASLYLHKTECFCFNQQILAAGEDVQMPMKFFIDPDIPKHITRLTLSYRLFNISPQT